VVAAGLLAAVLSGFRSTTWTLLRGGDPSDGRTGRASWIA